VNIQGAVFLSYASQDAEAAKRICEALRGAGTEVWFDQSQLRGGDAWDQSIRKQIKECALFVAVISQNTQERQEGYFRLEWRLADQRTHLMSRDRAFLVPVVIDGTSDKGARVPDSFTEVQWTRLPGGETPPAFCERVKKLLSKSDAEPAHQSPAAGGATSAPHPVKPSRPWLVPAIAGVIACVALAIWQPWHKGGMTPAPAPAAAPVSEARQLVAKAWEQLNKTELGPEELELADGYCKRAAELDATDADVWAAWSQVNSWYSNLKFDVGTARREAARSDAVHALKLAPGSFEARLAQACYLVRANWTQAEPLSAPEADQMLRQLLKEKPDEPRALRALGNLQYRLHRWNDARDTYSRLARNPQFAALAWCLLSHVERQSGSWPSAEKDIDRSLAIQPCWQNLSEKMEIALLWRGDLDAAKDALDRIPSSIKQTDFMVPDVYTVYWYRHEPDKALEFLSDIPRDWITGYDGPTGFLMGQAHQMAGRNDAARIDWQTALKLVEHRLVDQPTSARLLHWKGKLLLCLGEIADAEKTIQLEADVSGSPDWDLLSDLKGAKGQGDAALDIVEQGFGPEITAAVLRLDPEFDSQRSSPHFKALLAQAEADPKRSPNAPQKTSGEVSAPDQRSVAVLAFTNLSDDKENEYFSDGISEELLTVLQKIPGLHVAARTSSFSFKGKSATAQEIGRTLGVANLVEGSVRKAGNKVRIAARLSRAATGEQVWSDTYTRDLQDVFAVQSEIALTIVEQLRGQLAGGTNDAEAIATLQTQVQAAEKGGTKNVEAHEQYLQGKYFANQYAHVNLARAAGCFRKAVESDPSFALAWAALARTSAVQAEFADTLKEATDGFAQARMAAERALALDPNLAEAHSARMEIQMGYDFDWRGARESLRRALELAPADATLIGNAARLASFYGDLEKAVELGRQAVELDPVNAEIRKYLGTAYSALGRFKEADEERRRAVELSPAIPWGHAGLAIDLVRQGRPEQALTEAEQENTGWARLTALAMANWALKDRAKADAVLARLIESFGETAAYQISEVYAYRREPDLAFQWLERAYLQHDAALAFTKNDPNLANLHGDPRWPAFLRKVGLSDDQLR
jgi:TolB-like protein/Flp pilus assembly protein TadD